MPEGTRTTPSLYERDYYAWTLDQAAKLRELARDDRSSVLDLDNLAEEVADLGKSERDAVRSQVRRIIQHLLKLRYSPSDQPRPGWKGSVLEARAALEDKLTATLRRDLADRLP